MKSKKAKKTLVAQVVIRHTKKDSKVPDFGMGKGVLLEQEITFTDENGRGFESPLFTMGLIEQEKRLIGECIEVKWVEKK